MKLKWHILFWFIYLIVESFIVYKAGDWNHRTIWHSILYHGSLLIPRILISYFFILYLLPILIKRKINLVLKILVIILYFVLGLLLYRIFLNKLSWPWIMGYFPNFDPFDIRLSSYSFLRLITPLCLLLGIISGYKGYYLKLRNEQLQKEQLKSELSYLKAQINPHFLFNSFNNLYVLAASNSENTAPAIEKLSSLFRYILQSSSLEAVSILDEIKLLESYVELERLRYDNIKIDFVIDISNGKMKIPPLLLLPFIENAFKHGASELLDDGMIEIKIRQDSNGLILTCLNSINPEIKKRNTNSGEGIKNVTKRLDLLFPEKYTLNQSIEDNFYKVFIQIPFIENSKS